MFHMDLWVAYLSTTANDGLLITTGHADGINLKLTGLQAQVGQMMHIDGATGTGWDGVDDTGCLHINTLIQNHTGATALFVDHAAAPIAAAQGACARFIQSAGIATTDGYLVEIAPTTLGGALHVSTGYARFAEKVWCDGGVNTQQAITDVADPPTQANMVTAFGAAATAGDAFLGVIKDANIDTTCWFCVSNGTSWYYAAKLTKGL